MLTEDIEREVSCWEIRCGGKGDADGRERGREE
jgi:hypothetical protein